MDRKCRKYKKYKKVEYFVVAELLAELLAKPLGKLLAKLVARTVPSANQIETSLQQDLQDPRANFLSPQQLLENNGSHKVSRLHPIIERLVTHIDAGND